MFFSNGSCSLFSLGKKKIIVKNVGRDGVLLVPGGYLPNHATERITLLETNRVSIWVFDPLRVYQCYLPLKINMTATSNCKMYVYVNMFPNLFLQTKSCNSSKDGQRFNISCNMKFRVISLHFTTWILMPPSIELGEKTRQKTHKKKRSKPSKCVYLPLIDFF